jgi:hypothetical protein
MVTKEQAQAAKDKLCTMFAGLMAGISKSGDDFIVAVRGETIPTNLPASLDDVVISQEKTSPVVAMPAAVDTTN